MAALELDPVLFSEEAVSEETRAFNAELVATLTPLKDMWRDSPDEIRRARQEGRSPFPMAVLEPSAHNFTIAADDRPLLLRHFKPKTGTPAGTYLHIHGGGWTLGSVDGQDVRLQEIADNCLLNCVSVDYRLAPEHPFPAGPDDCEAAAAWLLDSGHGLNTDFLAMGGESAGAHLCALTLLRLRDRLGACPFHGANLTAGVFDMGGTPSSRNWGDEKLILDSRDMVMFAAQALQGGEDVHDPAHSPLYANLKGMPPALFSVGTRDLLLDDTLLMATRWHAANGNAQLDITPGGCHTFQSFPQLTIAQASNARIDAFLNAAREARK